MREGLYPVYTRPARHTATAPAGHCNHITDKERIPIMFVRKRVTTAGNTWYYLVESYREDGKTRQRNLFRLGRYATVQEKLACLAVEVKMFRRWRCGLIASRCGAERDQLLAILQRQQAKCS